MPAQKFPLHRILVRTGASSTRQTLRNNTMFVTRTYAVSSSKDATGSDGYYVSPFQEIFDTIKEGKTFMGNSKFSTPEIKYLKCGIPEHVLRYKTKSYGRLLEEPFVQPNEHKVTLQVETEYIPLNELERVVMKEIVGNRLNEETGLLQLSSSQFGSRIENKRHAVSMLERIVDSARALAAKVDSETKMAEES